MKLPLVTAGALKRLAVLGVVLGGFGVYEWSVMLRMPGKSHQGPLPPLAFGEENLLADLKRDIQVLAVDIGERNLNCHPKLAAAADFLEKELVRSGYTVQQQGYEVEGRLCHNLETEIRGKVRPEEIVVVGAHYDSVIGTPGANDNATGAAAVIALARAFKGRETARTLRFVEFVNEEPPYFQTSRMGSVVYAKRCRQRNEKIVAMLSLETIGYYTDAKNSQQYPPPFNWFFPSTGNFVAFVGNTASKALVREVLGSFRRHARFPSEGVATFEMITGIGWSDHWAFWKEGYPALMVTDTAPFRYVHYHSADDTPDRINYPAMACVVAGLEKVVGDLAGVK